MKINIYLDDERPTPLDRGFVRAYTAKECINILQTNPNKIGILSLDHDLGEPVDSNGTGNDVACWLEEQAYSGNWDMIPDNIIVHSANPVGRKNMQAAIDNINRWRDLLSE